MLTDGVSTHKMPAASPPPEEREVQMERDSGQLLVKVSLFANIKRTCDYSTNYKGPYKHLGRESQAEQ